MVIDQDILDLFPAPPQHGQARKSDISAFAFPSKTTPVLDNRVFAYPANEKPLPVLPLNLDRVSANQRKVRRGAISSASQRAPFAQNSAITNQNAWGPPPSAPPDMPLPPLPSQSPLSSRRLHSASGQALRNKSSFFIDRPVRRAKSTRSLGANVRLQPGPVSYNPTVIHRQHTHTNLHLRYLRPIPDVPADVGVDMVVTADPTDSVKENDGVSRKGSRKSNCRCAILFDESGNFVKRTGHYLTTCPLYNGGER
ncbi:hypothetical protein V5O48_000685 [Marasmius crinis-equi]|uniref:Uncharacterized protein n=1 Tax=Marasmius crinis-equi TaxID=585013 RepID=A0ABR3G0D9_9AGAR